MNSAACLGTSSEAGGDRGQQAGASWDQDGSSGGDGAEDGEAGAEPGSEDEGGGSTGASDSSGGDDSGSEDPGPSAPEIACTPTIELVDTSRPTAVIGTGTAASCRGSDLKAAAEQGGTILFDCGPDPVTVALDETIVLPIDRDTIIDGGHLVTLDAQGSHRHFLFDHPDWLNNTVRVVLQRLTLINGAAPLGEYFAQDPQMPNCAYGYKDGSGGAVYMRNGRLHVIDSAFYDNQAARIGPDVGGGAIYVLGVPEVIISGTVFRGNRAANGGAIGMLFANPRIENSLFEDNTAEGMGTNYVEPGCPTFNHDAQGGAGGNSGAISFDGLNDEGVIYSICGTVFRNNRANEIGGALLRTPNAGRRQMLIDRCTFMGNTARMGGVSFIKDNDVTVRASTFADNHAGINVAGESVQGFFGGLWINSGTLDLENSTFSGNLPSGLDVEGTGTVKNATFVASPFSGGLSVDNSLFVDTACGATMPGVGNMQWPAGLACAGEATFTAPELGELGDHGGPTPTFVPGVAAAVMGVATGCPSVDQRGQTRDPRRCAAGSVEPG